MKLINVEPLLKRMSYEDLSKKEMRRMIRNAEEMDIVFCAECIHYMADRKECCMFGHPAGPDDFCSIEGERKG